MTWPPKTRPLVCGGVCRTKVLACSSASTRSSFNTSRRMSVGSSGYGVFAMCAFQMGFVHTLVLSAQLRADLSDPVGVLGIIVSMEHVLPFASLNSVKDLQSFVTRAKTLDTTGVRFVVTGNVLAASVSVMHPAGLGDGVPIVIGLRTFALDFSNHPRFELDSVFAMDAVTDRTHRMISSDSTAFTLPPSEISVTWTALNPPRS